MAGAQRSVDAQRSGDARRPVLREVVVADDPAAWARAGLAPDGEVVRAGGVAIRLAGRDAGRRIVGLAVDGVAAPEADGIRLAGTGDETGGASASDPVPGPLGVSALDHVVAISPDLDRTIAALEAAGLELRRLREQPSPAGAPRQAFFNLGTAILEVIQEPPEAVERGGGRERPAFFWGLALVCDDLDAAARRLGDGAAPVRNAVQPGRRILPLRREAGLALPVALMSPRPR